MYRILRMLVMWNRGWRFKSTKFSIIKLPDNCGTCFLPSLSKSNLREEQVGIYLNAGIEEDLTITVPTCIPWAMWRERSKGYFEEKIITVLSVTYQSNNYVSVPTGWGPLHESLVTMLLYLNSSQTIFTYCQIYIYIKFSFLV